jgi:hypothetical protein
MVKIWFLYHPHDMWRYYVWPPFGIAGAIWSAPSNSKYSCSLPCTSMTPTVPQHKPIQPSAFSEKRNTRYKSNLWSHMIRWYEQTVHANKPTHPLCAINQIYDLIRTNNARNYTHPSPLRSLRCKIRLIISYERTMHANTHTRPRCAINQIYNLIRTNSAGKHTHPPPLRYKSD